MKTKAKLLINSLILAMGFIMMMTSSCELYDQGESEPVQTIETINKDMMVGTWTMLRWQTDGVTDSDYSGVIIFRYDDTGHDKMDVKYSGGSVSAVDEDFTWSLSGNALSKNMLETGVTTTETADIAGSILTISYTTGDKNITIDYTK